jgi:hypothetical protein
VNPILLSFINKYINIVKIDLPMARHQNGFEPGHALPNILSHILIRDVVQHIHALST